MHGRKNIKCTSIDCIGAIGKIIINNMLTTMLFKMFMRKQEVANVTNKKVKKTLYRPGQAVGLYAF